MLIRKILKSRYHFLWQALSVASAGFPTLADSQESSIRPIFEDRVSSATQSIDETIAYSFDATGGQTYLIEIDQQDLDFVIEVTGPDGIHRFHNSPLLRYEKEYVLLEESIGGQYRIGIASYESTNSVGAHSIRISRLNDQSTAGVSAITAWRLMNDAALANSDGERPDPDDALRMYETAASSWREQGNTRLRAQSLYAMAMIEFEELYDWAAAADYSAEAARLYASLDETFLSAVATATMADALSEVGNQQNVVEAAATFERAISLYDDSYASFEQSGKVYEIGLVQNNKGLAYFYEGDFERAASLWRDAAAIFAGLGEWKEEANTSQNIAVVEVQQGYNESAIEIFEGILQRLPANREDEFRAAVLDNLAQAQRSFGNADASLQAASAALQLYRRLDDHRGQTFSLLNIGRTYFQFGELTLARDYLNQALPMAEQTNDGRSKAMILTTLGGIAYIEGDYEAASIHHRAAVDSSVSRPDRVYRETLLARDLAALGQYDTAIATLNDSLATARQERILVTEADALRELGLTYVDSGAAELGYQHLIDALSIYQNLRLQNEQAITLDGLAAAARAMGDIGAAVAFGNHALDLLETLRQSVSTPELRAFYSAVRRRPFENQVDLLMEEFQASGATNEAYLRDALTVSERARARMTMDLIAESSVNLTSDADEALLARQSDLYRELFAKQYQRDSLVERPLSATPDQMLLDELLQDLTTIETELDLVEAELRRNRSQFEALSTNEPLNAAAIQSSLDPDTVLVQFMLGDEQSYVWVITDDSLQAARLSGRRYIEDAARSAYENLEAFAADSVAERARNDSLDALADQVLTPVARLLPGEKKRVLISPDGALHYIPFGILSTDDDGSPVRLMERHELINVPSMSVYVAQESRVFAAQPSRQLAIFADPVFDLDDPRLGEANLAVASTESGPAVFQSAPTTGRQLTRLVSTGREAAAISAMVPDESRLMATGLAANRDTVVNSDLSDYKYVHFATHGIVDSRHPALSALALSMFEPGGMPLDGFLRLPDIYSLNLNADLVVLSACETALGRNIRGEGLVGLTQGFMYAGAKSLVVSLWQVPDAATAVLMTRFYEHLLEDAASPAEALRLAQLSIASERRWRNPYFWAGFISVGSP